jgi:hypothetical protein
MRGKINTSDNAQFDQQEKQKGSEKKKRKWKSIGPETNCSN